MTRYYLYFISVLLVWSSAAFAQGGRPDDQRGWERIEQLRKVRLIELLDLKEEQSVRFFARLKEHDAARHDLVKEKDDSLDKIERLLRNHASAEEYQPVFDDAHGVDMKIVSERKKFFDSLTDILNIEQRAKFLIFERRFERELRDAFREAQRRRHQGEPENR
jgi:hypothetical protein